MGAAMKFAQARLSPPTFAQVASEAALDTPQSYFDEVISEYRERRDTLITELHKIEGAGSYSKELSTVSLNFY
jgi:aspartate aminotransferase